MISGYESFTYIGYTHGGAASGARPTLYFKEGRYTQDHNEFTNIGWHPNRPGLNYAFGNVREDMVKSFQRHTNISAFMAGGCRSTDTTGVRLFECYTNAKGEVVSTHVSRGRLVLVGDRDFNQEFNEAYARRVLYLGSYALNNISSIKKERKNAR